MWKPGAINADRRLPCPIDGCSSQPFMKEDISKHMHVKVWSHPLLKNVEDGGKEVMALQKKTEEVADEINDRQKNLSSVVDLCLKALTLQNAHLQQFNVCPTIVVITRIAADRSKDLKTWFTNLKKKKYNVVFYCEHSGDPGHEPFEISVDKQWFVKVAPWLRIVVNIAAALDKTNLASAVAKEFPLAVHTKEMKALIDTLGDERTHGKTQTLMGDALRAIAEMAYKMENLAKWRESMVAVVGTNGRTIWVKKEFEKLYAVSSSVDFGDEERQNKVDVNVQLDDVGEYAQAEEDGTSLGNVMTTRMDEPIELSYEYIKRFINGSCKLGSGAFGDVFLAEDSSLPKKFVVKMITLSERSDGNGPNEDYLKNFQNELSTLKRFHHPNILDLYGYNFKSSFREKALVYEYAANGSLDGFLANDYTRALLPAATRLSIMYEMARALHFLHSGGAGFKVFHRDIKSANIYLSEDFTPKLIDCGLAKFVEDEHNAVPSQTTKQTSSTEGPAIGTIGYMCPEYASKKTHRIKCDYIAAYDVYSIGVVMAELILGYLNGDPTNVFETYVVNGESPIVDGWKQLQNDADGQANWSADALELVCQTALGCITPSSEGRLSTGVLLPRLHRAITVNAGRSGVVLGGEIDDDVIAMLSPIKFGERDSAITFEPGVTYGAQGEVLNNMVNHLRLDDAGRNVVVPRELFDAFRNAVTPINSGKGSSDPGGADHELLCLACNKRRHVVKCGQEEEPHPLCDHCIDDAVAKGPKRAVVDFELPCLIDWCSSLPFESKDVRKRVHPNTWTEWWEKNRRLHEAENNKRLKELSSEVGLCLKALTLQNAHLQQFKVCPTVAVITRTKADRSKDLKAWFTNVKDQKYNVVFYCERSGVGCHDPFEISVDKQWFVTVVPWLRIVISAATAWDPSKVSPAVIKEFPELSFRKHSEEMAKLIEKLGDKKKHGTSQTFDGGALKAMADMAVANESQWKHKMKALFCGKEGRTIWVKKDDEELCA